MRKLIFAINLTLDGCCDHTKGNPDNEMMGYYTRLVREADTFLWGRKTYQLMVPYWPDVAKSPAGHTKANYEYAQAFEAISRIIVFSHSLKSPGDKKTNIFRTGICEEIIRLKKEEGKNILTGGVDIPSQLLDTGLIDEFRFVVHPIVVGEGRRLFDSINLLEKLQLKLIDQSVFKSGGVALRYLKQ